MSSAETVPALPIRPLSKQGTLGTLGTLPTPASRGSSATRSSSDYTGRADDDTTPASEGTSRDLSDVQRARLEIYEANKDLQDLCRDNGLSAAQFAKKAHTVTTLDMFLGFWPSMKSVLHFVALRELSIVKHPTIIAIEGLESCANLEQLTIAECGLQLIENLETCQKLKKLNLNSNTIQSMAPLSKLAALEELWLCDNRIESLDGLWGATKLTTLWICRNRIERIDAALNGCPNLTELNLADNRISSFKSLLSLANFDRLGVLTLSDPHYGDNPVCRLCNYQTYLMCQLPRLTWLDTVELSSRNKQIAEATMLKKKMYYNMRIKCMKRDVQHRIRRANDVRRINEQHIELNISALSRHKKEIEQALSDLEGTDAGQGHGTEAQVMRAKLEAIDDCLREKCRAIATMNHDFDGIRSHLQYTADVNISRLMLELDTGGNIRLEDGSPSDAWYASCVDLVKSRLFAADLRPFGIADVRITRVTRINNRFLRNRFHARMEEILVVNDDQVKENVSKKGVTVSAKENDEDGGGALEDTIESVALPGFVSENALEYLFYGQPPMVEYMRKPDPDQFYAAEYGFRDPREYQAMGFDGAIKLSNSVSLVETARLLTSFASKGASLQKRELSGESITKYATISVREQENELRTEFTREMRDATKLAAQGQWKIPGGTLLVVKVFPGYTKTVMDSDALPSPVDQKDHTGLHSVQVVKSSRTTNEHSAQKMYYIFDKTLVLPEYLVEYQYVTSSQQAAAMEAVISPAHDGEAEASHAKSAAEDDSGLGVAAAKADEFERRYRIRRLSTPRVSNEESVSPDATILDDAVLRLLETGLPSSESMLPITRINLVAAGRLKQLYLIGCGMEVMPDLSMIKEGLEVLVLAYNRIPHLDASLQLLTKLKHLDVSCNRLLRIDHLDNLTSLVDLDASGNQIQTFDDLTSFSHGCKAPLRRLNLRKNSVCSAKRYRLRMLRATSSSLEVLDEQEIARDEYVASQRLLTKLSADVLWSRYQSTNAAVSPSTAREDRNESAACDVDKSPCWTAVEDLILTRELISCIEGFDFFVNLRILSFADNALRHIDGLQNCTRLEELNLEDNDIAKIENLSSLVFLKRLNLARNRLMSIDQLETLANLTQLSLEDNLITSLRGLASAMKLMELYVGNNRIENLNEVQHLKALPKLTILDLSGNDIARRQDYRLYTVYYVRRVKVLDGVSVSPQEQSEAKQQYSGKLTLEFIAEKCSGSHFDRLQELDLSSCRIRELGSIHGKTFPNLRDLNVENNQISDILGLEALPKLRTLNLNRNRIEQLLLSPTAMGGAVPDAADKKGILSCPKLEQLFLAYNQINDMSALGLPQLDSLRVLHLQGNAIVFVGGLEANTELLELRLDKNKIRQLDPQSTQSLRRLRVLSVDDNGLRSLSNFNDLLSIEFLDLSNNRLGELEELDKLTSLPTIVELHLVNNPLVKKHTYRPTVVFKLNTLRSLDGRDITADERERVEMLFLHERTAAVVPQSVERPANLPSTQFNLAPSTVPSKHKLQVSTTSAPMTTTRSLAPQPTSSDGIAGSLLRKSSMAPAIYSPNQQHPAPSVSTFPKSAHPPAATITIAPSTTTTKNVRTSNTNMAAYRSYSVSNQAGASTPPITMTVNAPSATITASVASALNASLSNAGDGQLNLGTLRFDRRRMNSIHYDPAFHGNVPLAGPVGMPTGATSLAGSVITSNSILRAPVNLPSPQTAITHPQSVDLAKGTTSTSLSGVSGDPLRSISGYVVSVGNQKKYGSIHVHDRMSVADLTASLANTGKSGSTLSRPR